MKQKDSPKLAVRSPASNPTLLLDSLCDLEYPHGLQYPHLSRKIVGLKDSTEFEDAASPIIGLRT